MNTESGFRTPPILLGVGVVAFLVSRMRDRLDLARNHYERLGHLTQGFVPAIITRELLLYLTPLKRGGWLFVLVTAVCLAVSACYEFIEWWAALIGGSAATDFLGTQGDVWVYAAGHVSRVRWGDGVANPPLSGARPAARSDDARRG